MNFSWFNKNRKSIFLCGKNSLIRVNFYIQIIYKKINRLTKESFCLKFNFFIQIHTEKWHAWFFSNECYRKEIPSDLASMLVIIIFCVRRCHNICHTLSRHLLLSALQRTCLDDKFSCVNFTTQICIFMHKLRTYELKICINKYIYIEYWKYT